MQFQDPYGILKLMALKDEREDAEGFEELIEAPCLPHQSTQLAYGKPFLMQAY